MDAILEKLKIAGLTGNESKVYLELLQKGELSANVVAKSISMDRTLTYTVLNHLIEKGMVSYIIRGNKKIFTATLPENLLNPIKEKETFVLDLISELKTIEKKVNNPTEINIFEGKDGFRALYRIMMKTKEILSFGATGRAYDLLYESPVIAKEMEKKGYRGKIITSPDKKGHPMAIKRVEIRYLDIKSEATTTIFGDYVSLHIIKDKPMIILIKNKDIANTYRNHFYVLWNVAKKSV